MKTVKALNVTIAGAAGRMGRALIESVLAAQDLRLHAALEQPGNAHLKRDAGELVGAPCGVAITDRVASAVSGADVLIDFTRPEGTSAHLAACRGRGVNMVIGTTGLSPAQKKALEQAARDIAIVFAPNMSVGVNLCLRLIATAAKALGEGFDIEIVEAHHRHKLDAPSGTALKMGEVAARASGRKLSECAMYGREGMVGERKPSTIGFATIRAGDIVGDHTVIFAGTGERVEITHKATSRATFAEGALRAARFLRAKKSGLYDMQDVLEFSK